MRLHYSSCGQTALSSRHAAVAFRMAAAAAAPMVPRLPVRCTASRSAEASTDEQSDAPKPRMRRSRLFKTSEGSDSGAAAEPAPAPAQQSADAGRAAVPVSEEFRKALQDFKVGPSGQNRLRKAAPRVRRDAAETGTEAGGGSSRQSHSTDEPQQQQQQRQQQRYNDDDGDKGGDLRRDRPARSDNDSDRSSRYGSDDRSSRYNSDDRSSRYGNDDRSSRYGSDDRSSRYGSDDRSSRYGSDDRSSRYGSDDRNSRYGKDDRSSRYNSDVRGSRYGSDDRSSRYNSNERSSRDRSRNAGEAAAGERRPWENRGSSDSGRFDRSNSAAAEDRPSRGGGGGEFDAQRQRWEREAQERAALAAEDERKRLIRKQRSEAIPTAPKPKQDKVIFQAITRDWDEKASWEELRGARASARKIARVAIYDRNKGIRAVRRKALQNPNIDGDEEAAKLAANAARQIQQAAALSIQPTREKLYEAAAGVKRSYERAEALAEGEWERLKTEYRTIKTPIKIGRKGASPALISQIQAAWRGKEVVKLVIHDDKSARKVNLPRLNLLYKELEERSGGVLIDAAGSSIWLYRGVNWVPAAVPPPYRPPPEHERFTQQHTPRGSWRDIAGISCYVVSSSDAAGLTSPPSSSSSSSGQAGSGSVSSSVAGDSSSSDSSSSSGDAMTLLLLPDQFSFEESQLMLQMADRVASKGALVILPDLLGPPASAPNSNLKTNGKTPYTKASGYWIVQNWPLVKKRKVEYMEWSNAGPGSWLQQRPRLLQLLEEMQQQGLYDKSAAAAAAAAGVSSTADSSSSSSSTSGRPLGILGLGWGTYLGLRAAGDADCVAAGIHAVAAMSPVTYFKDYDIATALQLPIALLPAKYDPMEQVMLTVDLLQRPYLQRCIFKRYGRVKPGWAHWLPQWIDPRAMYQAAEQMLMSVAFLKRELLGEDSALLPPPLTAADKAPAEQAVADEAAADSASEADEEGAEEDQQGSDEQESEDNQQQ